MPVEITYHGNNALVLAQVCEDADLDISGEDTGCLANSVHAAYAAAGIPQEFFGNRLNEIERLAALAGGSFVCPVNIPFAALTDFGAVPFPVQIGLRHVGYSVAPGAQELSYNEQPQHLVQGCGRAPMPADGQLRVFQAAIQIPNFNAATDPTDGRAISIGVQLFNSPGAPLLPYFPDGLPIDYSKSLHLRARYGHLGNTLEISSSHPSNSSIHTIPEGNYETGILIGIYLVNTGQWGCIIKDSSGETDLGLLDDNLAGATNLAVGAYVATKTGPENMGEGDLSIRVMLLASEMEPMTWPAPARDWKNQVVT